MISKNLYSNHCDGCGNYFESPYEEQYFCSDVCAENMFACTGVRCRKCSHCNREFEPKKNEVHCSENCRVAINRRENKEKWKKQSVNRFKIYERDKI